MNTTATNVRYSPQLTEALGQTLAAAIVAGILIPVVDFFKFADQRSILRTLIVAACSFGVVFVIFWFKSGRRGCHAFVLDEKSLTIEDKNERTVIPWNELEEVVQITYGMGGRLKFKSRNRRDYIKVDSTGHSPQQWEAIKKDLSDRGITLTVGQPEP